MPSRVVQKLIFLLSGLCFSRILTLLQKVKFQNIFVLMNCRLCVDILLEGIMSIKYYTATYVMSRL